MPELPEVETVARTLYPHIHGYWFASAELLRLSTLHELSLPLDKLLGLRIDRIWRRGKLLLLDLAPLAAGAHEPLSLVIHLRMTGRFFTKDANRELGRHTRCIFGLAGPNGVKKQLFFDDTRAFGKILLADSKILQKWKFWRELGPEPLEIGEKEFASRFGGQRPLKVSLLDQKVVAGIGNIYADESLFKARLLPLRQSGSLTAKESQNLRKAIKSVLSLSISQCGSSIKDYRDADGNVGSFQNNFLVYGRGGQECKICGSILEKTRLGGRATVFCPRCQK